MFSFIFLIGVHSAAIVGAIRVLTRSQTKGVVFDFYGQRKAQNDAVPERLKVVFDEDETLKSLNKEGVTLN